MAFYTIYGQYLGKDANEAVDNLDDQNCWLVARDYLCKDFHHSELGDFGSDVLMDPSITLRGITRGALENLRDYWPERDYYGVRWKDDEPSNNRRPTAGRSRTSASKKAPNNSRSKAKAPARKPTNRRY